MILRNITLYTVVFTALFFTTISSGFEYELNGFVDTFQSIKQNEPNDFLSSRTKVHLESWVTGEIDELSAFASVYAAYNGVYYDETELDIWEVFVDYSAENWDLRLGKQTIIWGKADGIAITDIVSPKDYTEFLIRDFDDIRIPVTALKWKYISDNFDIEIIYLPLIEKSILPPDDCPWSVKAETSKFINIEYENEELPRSTFENGEIAVKYNRYGRGIDYSISIFRTWDDLPVFHREVSFSGSMININVTPRFHRLTVAGGDIAWAKREFVVRGEATFCSGKHFEPENPLSEKIYENNSLNMLAGVDYTPGNNWMFTAQLADMYILNYEDEIMNDEHSKTGTLSISKKLLHETLEPSLMCYFGLNDGDGFMRFSVDYAVTDDFHMIAGIDIFYGDEGRMGMYDDNDGIFLKVKYSF